MELPHADTLTSLAIDMGFPADSLEKELRLKILLNDIAQDEILSKQVVLKGGTALHLFHLDLPRLSVDIDLSYVASNDRARMVADRPMVEASVDRILLNRGYDVRRRPSEHAGGKRRIRFRSVMGGTASLEVDVGYMARQPLFGMARMDSVTVGGLQAKDVPVLDLHDIVAGKLSALFSRETGRDLFDARQILSINGLDWTRIKTALLALGASGREDWREVSVKNIRGRADELVDKLKVCLPLNYFADKKQTAAWFDETIALCRERYAFLLEYSDSERAFLDALLDRGEIDAGLLDTDPDLRERIQNMPMLAWKALNVRKHKGLSA